MNILVINHYAGSLKHGMEYRPFYLGREWVRMGHRVTIAAASYSHGRTTAPVMSDDVTEEEIEGVRYLWFRTPAYEVNGVRRAANILAFVGKLFRHRKLLEGRCRDGVAIASSTYPFDAVPGVRIARVAGARFVFEVHDLWPLSPIELAKMSPRHPFIMLAQWAENFAYSHAECVVSLLPRAEPHMREHGLRPGRFVHIPNGICAADWSEDGAAELPVQHQCALGQLKEAGKFVVGYAGSHGLANCLDTLVEAAGMLRDRSVSLMLVGNGPQKAALQAETARKGLSNVVFLPSIPKRAVPTFLSSVDGLVLCFAKRSLYRFGVSPNKLLDYMMSGRPIVQALDAGNDLVREANCGLSVPAEDPRALRDAIERIASMPAEVRGEMGERGRRFAMENHDYAVLSARFLESVANAPRLSCSAHRFVPAPFSEIGSK